MSTSIDICRVRKIRVEAKELGNGSGYYVTRFTFTDSANNETCITAFTEHEQLVIEGAGHVNFVAAGEPA